MGEMEVMGDVVVHIDEIRISSHARLHLGWLLTLDIGFFVKGIEGLHVKSLLHQLIPGNSSDIRDAVVRNRALRNHYKL